MRKKIAFITGVAGQDGPYLVEVLLRYHYTIIGLVRPGSQSESLKAAGLLNKVTFVPGSLLDKAFLSQCVEKYRPDEIYNLAAQSSVAESWRSPEETFVINAIVPLHFLEIIRQQTPQTRFFQASSSEIYGDVGSTITEKAASNPLNPYGISKLAAHLAVDNYRATHDLFACNGILFSHTSPRQLRDTVAKNITRSAAQISLGLVDKMIVGDMTIKRDWAYAGDVAEAMWLMLQQKKPGDYIVANGVSYSIAEFIAEALGCVGIKQWKKYVTVDSALIRKNDIKNMVGSPRTLKKIGWKPKVTFHELVKMLVNYELEQLKK